MVAGKFVPAVIGISKCCHFRLAIWGPRLRCPMRWVSALPWVGLLLAPCALGLHPHVDHDRERVRGAQLGVAYKENAEAPDALPQLIR